MVTPLPPCSHRATVLTAHSQKFFLTPILDSLIFLPQLQSWCPMSLLSLSHYHGPHWQRDMKEIIRSLFCYNCYLAKVQSTWWLLCYITYIISNNALKTKQLKEGLLHIIKDVSFFLLLIDALHVGVSRDEE